MSEPLSTDSYKGVRDFYPSDWARLSAVFARIRTTLTAWGYEEYNASPLERAELYESKGNDEIVNEQTYTFTDRGDRRVTLRPEMTPTLARMVAGKRRELAFPLRWFSIPNVFRYERPQKGRLREHYQLNVDLVGLPEGEADLEVVTIASKLLKSFGAKDSDFSIHVNSRALLNRACKVAGLPEGEAAKAYWQLVDKRAKMPPEAFEEARKEFSADPLSVIESGTDTEVVAERERLLAFVETLKARGVANVIFDTSIVRGFDYYTGIVFEVFDTNPENNRSMFGGGRYDGLVTLFGGEPVPAFGFGMGDVTLADFLETHGLTPSTGEGKPQIYLGTPLQSDIPAAQTFADELRNAGARVFVNLTNRGLGDQIKDAVKRGVPLFAAYGKDEQEKGTIRLKILATSEETSLPTSELSSRLAGT
jgi:histidyl-tRNA synthetase